MAFPPAFDRVWDETFPPDTQAANLLGQDIRNTKIDLRQRISLISGTLANRPTPDASWGGANFGMIYLATDTSQLFQWSGAAWVDITSSLAVPTGGTGAERVVSSGTINVAANGNTDLLAAGSVLAGFYRVNLYGVTTAITGAGTSTVFTLNWTDEVQAQTGSIGGPTGTAVGGLTWRVTSSAMGGGGMEVRCAAGNAINLSYVVTPNSGGTSNVRIYYRVTFLG